jgi:rhodanese-related sulfurtransferase
LVFAHHIFDGNFFVTSEKASRAACENLGEWETQQIKGRSNIAMADVGEIEPLELKARRDRGEQLVVLDVREPEEIAIAPFPDATHIPMADIPSRLTELDPEAEWIVVCHHGVRSAQVAMYLARMGFEHVRNLSGGIDEWSLTADPSTPRY